MREFFPFKYLRLLGGVSVLALCSSCSPGMFGNGVDATVANRPGYRHINLACANLDVSGAALDTKTFRSLVKCLNSGDNLAPLAALTDKVADEDLEPLLSTINKYWLNNPKKLYQVEKTYDDLLAKGLLDPTFKDLGKLLENEEFWTNLIVTLREAYF